MRHHLRAALLGASPWISCASGVFADEPASLPGAVTYGASASCPPQEEFWRQVLGHLRSVPAKRLRPIHVQVLQGDGVALARVTFEDDRGASGTRELSGANCVEAAAAAALVVALEIDAQVEESAAPAKPAEPPIPAPSSKAPVRAPPARMPPSDPLVDRPPPDVAATNALVWTLGAGAVAEHAVAPSPLFGVGAFLGVGQREAEWDLRANFVYMRSGVVEEAGQSAEFVLLGGRLEGCAFPFLDLKRSTLGPCLAAELASVRSSGQSQEGFEGSDEFTAWFAIGPLLRFRQAFAELHLELSAGPWFPIAGTRTFVFDRPEGENSFHEVPFVGWMATAGLSLDLDSF